MKILDDDENGEADSMLYKRGDEKYTLEATIDNDTPVPLCDFRREAN